MQLKTLIINVKPVSHHGYNKMKETLPMKFACSEHIDNAIDDYVDIKKVAPEVTFVHEWKKADGSQLDAHCDFCGEPATYVLTHKTESEQ